MNDFNDFNVALILPRGFTMGGSNVWSAQLASRLAAGGCAVALVEHEPPEGERLVPLPMAKGVTRVSCDGPPIASAGRRALDRFAACYEGVLPAVFVPNFSAAAYGACARLSQRAADRMRVIGICHSDQDVYYAELSYYEPVIHAFVAVSEEVAAVLRTRMPERAADVHVRPCAVDVPRTLRRSYSSPGEPLRIVYAGRIADGQKKMSNMVPLVKALERRGVDFRLRVVGEGPYREWLRHEISELTAALRKCVSLEDAVPPDAMPGVWSGADVSILLSEFEGTSMSMMEAMGHGCVPVVTRVSGTAAVLRDGENGYMTPVGDVEAMADRIAHVASHRDELARVGQAAHATVAGSYAYDHYVPWFLDLIRRAWDSSPRPWPGGKPLLMPNARTPLFGMLKHLFRRPVTGHRQPITNNR